MVETLLLQQGDVNAADNAGITALMIAAEKGQVGLVEMLLNKGVDVEAKNKDGLKAIDKATGDVKSVLKCYNPADHGPAIAAAALLRRSSSHEIESQKAEAKAHKDAALMTPIQVRFLQGIEKGDNEEVSTCLHIGVELEIKDSAGDTALIIAVRRGNQDIAVILLERGANIEAIDKLGRTALYIAVAGYHPEVLETLLELGADRETRDNRGLTALMFAVMTGYHLMVEALLKGGAQTEAADEYGCTVLTLAIQIGHEEIVKTLLKQGANTVSVDRNGDTALMYASRYGHQKVVKLVIDNGANLEAFNYLKSTALMIAATNGHKQLVESFLSIGTDKDVLERISFQNKDGKNAIDVAKTEEIQLILQNEIEVSF
jgi:ankyrin repeat protein